MALAMHHPSQYPSDRFIFLYVALVFHASSGRLSTNLPNSLVDHPQPRS